MKNNSCRKQIFKFTFYYRGDMMEVLGYQLIKIDKTTYDASVLAKYEKLEDILQACGEKGLDITYYGDGKLILESIE